MPNVSSLNSGELPSFEKFKKKNFAPDRARLGISFLQGLGNSGTDTTDLGSGFKAFSPNFSSVANATVGELDQQRGQFREDEKFRLQEHLTKFKGFLDQQKLERTEAGKNERAKDKQFDDAFQDALKRRDDKEIARLNRELKEKNAKDAEAGRNTRAGITRETTLGVEEQRTERERIKAEEKTEKDRKKAEEDFEVTKGELRGNGLKKSDIPTDPILAKSLAKQLSTENKLVDKNLLKRTRELNIAFKELNLAGRSPDAAAIAVRLEEAQRFNVSPSQRDFIRAGLIANRDPEAIYQDLAPAQGETGDSTFDVSVEEMTEAVNKAIQAEEEKAK